MPTTTEVVIMNLTTSVPRTAQPSQYSEATIIGQACFLILIIVAAFLGNCLVVGAVWTTRKLRKSTNYFIVSLAVSDILIAVTVMPFHVHHYLNLMIWNLGSGMCQLWLFMDFLCSTASITNVALISIDRFLALTYPFKYPRIVNNRRCVIAIAAVWGYAGLLSSLSFEDWSEDALLVHKPACAKIDKIYYVFSTMLGIFLPLVILVVAYSLVFRLALRQAIAIKAHSTVHSPLNSCPVESKEKFKGERVMKNRLLIRELKATKTLLIVVGTFLICWFPLFVLLLVQQYCPKCITKRLSSTAQQIIGITFVYTLPRLNSAVNPIIYSIFNREFRSVLCLFCDKVTNVLPRVTAGCALNRGGSLCGMAKRKSQNTSENSAYETSTEYLGFSAFLYNEKNRSMSLFRLKNSETYYYETSV